MASTEPLRPDPILSGLFSTERVPSEWTRYLLLIYSPIGILIFLFRACMGLHTFLAACILRKTHALRGVVLRVMTSLLGIVITESGQREPSCRMLVANHVSTLDHLAIDLLRPCLLPSVWDLPNLLRWCFGYADLGAGSGRSELVRQSKEHVSGPGLPLLAFPEGAMTNGKKGLLKFSTWPFEVSDRVQPISIRLNRPLLNVASTVLGEPWWQDSLWFLFLPFTIINIKWLSVLTKESSESVESFAIRVSASIASDLGLEQTELTSAHAVEAAKRYVQQRRFTTVTSHSVSTHKKSLDPRRMDEIAMRIKQSHPTVPLIDIRKDLDKTKDMQTTVDRIKTGALRLTTSSTSKRDITADPTEWRKHFEERKWQLIENNRSKYLNRMMASGDH